MEVSQQLLTGCSVNKHGALQREGNRFNMFFFLKGILKNLLTAAKWCFGAGGGGRDL